jgi:seryl-tRNA synthetase
LSRAKVDNFGTLQQEIRDAGALVNHIGAAFRNARILKEYVDARIGELNWAVRTHELCEQEKEEQRQIREQMREEERALREYERAIREATKEEELIRRAMEKAQGRIAQATEEQKAQFEAQLTELEEKLQRAEEKNQRALSMAQQTKAGHVYVSNIGSFGEHVYKVGLTRRLEPLDRVRELGDASVPFAFDVHAMIWSENAPALETTLHRTFVDAQVNKVNPRKEFFRLGLADLRKVVEEMGLNVAWTMAAKAAEFHESLAIQCQIQADPAVHDRWFRQQLAIEAALTDEEETTAELTASVIEQASVS